VLGGLLLVSLLVLGGALAPAGGGVELFAGQEPAAAGRPGEYPIRPVPLTAVRLTDDFWRPRLDTNRAVTIPHILRENEITGRVANFLKAAHKVEGTHQGQRYNDTDVYKIIEAASYALAASADPALDQKLDDLIAIVAAAQEPDGYLYTPRSVNPKDPAAGAGPERWSWLHTSHELYNAGHLYEAAAAHYQATGKRTLLDVAIRNADLVCKVFGPDARHDVPGHEEVELALVKLFRVTGDRKYLDQARFFLEERGRPHTVAPVQFEPGNRFSMYNDLAYRQDHLPVAEQTKGVGHAVRATYLYSGMTDIATLLGATAFGQSVEAIWRDIRAKRIYLTGGLGSQARTEAFGDDYVLPNRAYAETCASIGGMLWYQRMFLRRGDAAYYDVFERTLYNGYLSGISLAGDTFFYQNPLVSDGKVERSAYFDVACCPANLARLMAQLPGLIYAQEDAATGSRPPRAGSGLGVIYVNLFIGSEATIPMGGNALRLSQQTDYPWQGTVVIHVDPERPADFTVAVRLPGWARGEAVPSDLYRFASNRQPTPTLAVNGQVVRPQEDKGYARLTRRWQKGDVVRLELPMPVRRVLASDGVAADRGLAAIERGPIVYCVEAIDNGGRVNGLRLPLDAALRYEFLKDLLGGVDVITGKARMTDSAGASRDHTLVAVPYFAWANRGSGEMAVWIPY
jgi:DUF1680 family protein